MDIQKIIEVENIPEIKIESYEENPSGDNKSILKRINKSENTEENTVLKELKVKFDQESEVQKPAKNSFWKNLNTKPKKESNNAAVENEPKNLLGVPEEESRRRSSIFDKLRFYSKAIRGLSPKYNVKTRHIPVSIKQSEENSEDDSEGVSKKHMKNLQLGI